MTNQPNEMDVAAHDEEERNGRSTGQVHTEDLERELRDPDAVSTATDAEGADREDAPLIDDVDDLQRRWEAVQAGFVDEPRQAVQEADALVAEAVQDIVATFSAERRNLEDQWAGGADVSTEELRLALQRYRSFFNRLLHT